MNQLVFYQTKANPTTDAIAKAAEACGVSCVKLDASAPLGAHEFASLKDARILHFGSSSLKREPSRSKLYEAIDFAAEQNTIVSYAPRITPDEWQANDESLRILRSPIVTADIIQVLSDDLPFLTGETEAEAAAEVLADQGVRLTFVMLEDGVLVQFRREQRKFSFDGICDRDVFLGKLLCRVAAADKPLKTIPLNNIVAWIESAGADLGQ
jgi:fructokinase